MNSARWDCIPMLKQKQTPKTDFAIVDDDRRAIEEIYAKLKGRSAQLIGPDGERRHLPKSVHAFLVDVLDAVSSDNSVLIIPNNAKLSTVEAAKLLGVSRQFLVNLLESGKIPHHKVGTHRRVYATDLFRYKAARDGVRRQAIRDFGADEVENGTYSDMSAADADRRP
jgi:excisionase family DNA binding protein